MNDVNNFRLVTLFEFTFVAAICLSTIAYIPPLGLILLSVYASSRSVANATQNGNRTPKLLMKTGAFWGIVAMYTIGTPALLVILASRFSESGSASLSWLFAILSAFVIGYGAIAAGLGALIGQWTGLYLSWRDNAA